jgi:hypothetical protein
MKPRIIRIAEYMPKAPDYFYRLDGDNILLVSKSPDASTILPITKRAKDLKGREDKSKPTKLPRQYKGSWFQMPNETEAAALSAILRMEYNAKEI